MARKVGDLLRTQFTKSPIVVLNQRPYPKPEEPKPTPETEKTEEE